MARLISWLGTQQGQLTALINQCLTVILEYIDLFKYLLAGSSQLLVGPTLGYAPKTEALN